MYIHILKHGFVFSLVCPTLIGLCCKWRFRQSTRLGFVLLLLQDIQTFCSYLWLYETFNNLPFILHTSLSHNKIHKYIEAIVRKTISLFLSTLSISLPQFFFSACLIIVNIFPCLAIALSLFWLPNYSFRKPTHVHSFSSAFTWMSPESLSPILSSRGSTSHLFPRVHQTLLLWFTPSSKPTCWIFRFTPNHVLLQIPFLFSRDETCLQSLILGISDPGTRMATTQKHFQSQELIWD